MLKVRNIENDLHASLAILGARPNIPYITMSISNNTSNAFKHTKPIVAIDCQLDWIRRWGALVASPLHIDAPFRFIHQVSNVRTVHRMHRHSLAPRDVAHNTFSAYGI